MNARVQMPELPPLAPGHYSLCDACNGYGVFATSDGQAIRVCTRCDGQGLMPHDCDRSLVEWGESE